MSDASDDVIEVPVLSQHDDSKPIGTIRLLRESVPSTACFNFEIGYTKNPNGSINLYEVSLCLKSDAGEQV